MNQKKRKWKISYYFSIYLSSVPNFCIDLSNVDFVSDTLIDSMQTLSEIYHYNKRNNFKIIVLSMKNKISKMRN